MTIKIICGDAREALAAMPEGSVHTCVTSPPYWGLRDYGLEPVVWGDGDCEHEWGGESIIARSSNPDTGLAGTGTGAPETRLPGLKEAGRRSQSGGTFCQRCNAWRGSLGLEPTPELYVEHIVQVMREVWRVLRDDGTLWLNLGDSYAGSGKGLYGDGTSHGTDGLKQKTNAGSVGLPSYRRDRRPREDDPHKSVPGLKPKDLCGMPWRVAFALQADGWWLRSDIVWSKPNPMPESVTDRPTRSHEYLFLLAKSARYYYDADAIREPHSPDGRKQTTAPLGNASHDNYRGADGHERWPNAGRNRRSVWEIATQPYPRAHFATFPEKLVEPCILAGTSERGCCPECGAPWQRVVEAEGGTIGQSWNDHDDDLAKGQRAINEAKGGHGYRRIDRGWRPACDHDAEPAPCHVLDPFAGSGTVGLVAERLGRHSVLIDASEDYVKMARERTAQMGLMVR